MFETTPNLAAIPDGFIVAFIMGGGISLCFAGLSKQGLPFSANKRVTGGPTRLIGIISLILSLIEACAWIFLKGAMG